MQRYVILLSVLSGTVFAFTLPPVNFTWLVYVALIPFLFFLHLEKRVGWKYLGSCIAGFIYATTSLWPLMSVNVWWWLSTSGYVFEHREIFMGLFLFGVALVSGSLFFFLFTFFHEKFIRKFARCKISVILASIILWLVLEQLRCLGLGGLMWQELGFAWWNQTWLRQIAEVVNLNGATAIIILINLLGYEAVKSFFEKGWKAGLKWGILIVGLFALLSTANCLLIRRFEDKETSNRKIAVIAVRSPLITEDSIGLAGFDFYMKLLDEVSKEEVDVIVFPENTLPFFVYDEIGQKVVGYESLQDRFDSFLKKTLSNPETIFILGMHTVSGGDRYNSSVLIQAGKVREIYHKRALLPLSELTPNIGPLTPVETLSSGKGDSGMFETKYLLQPLLCSEIFYRNTYQNFGDEHIRSKLIVLSGNDSIFSNPLVSERVRQIATMRAIEERVSIVTSTKGPEAWVINMRGVEVANTKGGEKSWVKVEVVEK